MRLATFNGNRLGVVDADGVHDVTARASEALDLPWPWLVNGVLAKLADAPGWLTVADRADTLPGDRVAFGPPVPQPTHVFAAPLNFRQHVDEMKGPIASGAGTAENLGFFLKATGAISGASDGILLPPLPERRFDYEGEIAFVIGREAKAVAPEEALEYIVGYTILIDATMRMTETAREERSLRKSFATFAPIGPWLVTADEIPDPSALRLRLWVNDELRQDSSLADLIVDIPHLLSRASHVVAMRPGDVFATGSPAGVGQLHVGDRVVATVAEIGSLELGVRARGW